MGGGNNEITISAVLDTVGFTKGTKQLEKAISGITGSVKRMATSIIGAASVYQILSKAVNAYMSQNQELSAQMNSMWTALGNVLGPIINQIVTWVTTAMSYFLEFLRLLGITSKTASQLSKQANKAGSELKKTVAGFDELNLLSSNSGGGGASGSLSDVDPVDWLQSFAEALKNKLWDDAADILIGKINEIIKKFKKKAYDLGLVIGEWVSGIAKILRRLITEVDWKGIGEAIGSFFMGLTEELDGKDLGTILVGKLTIALKAVTGFLETDGLGQRIASLLKGIFIGAINSIAGAIGGANWKKIGENVRQFFEELFDSDGEVWEAVKNAVDVAWNALIDFLWGLLSGDSEEKPPMIKALEDLGESIKNFGESMAPILKDAYENYIKPFGEWLISTGLPDVIESVSKAIDLVSTAIKGLYDLINGNVSAEEYFKGLTDAWNGFIESIKDSGKVTNNAGDEVGWLEHAVRSVIDPTYQLENAWGAIKDIFSSNKEVEDTTGSVNNLGETSQNVAGELEDSAKRGGDAFSGLAKSVKASGEDAATYLSGDFTGEVDSALGGVSSNAGWWGSDLVDNFVNGALLRRSVLGDAMAKIASIIRDYLGFSEPEEGPLSNFHTYGPDMMKLYAEGIEGNKGRVVSAVNGVAEDVADAMGQDLKIGSVSLSDIGTAIDKFSDKIVEGFTTLMDRLQAIAQSVSFSMPAMAGGGILPYSVGAYGGYGSSDAVNVGLTASVDRLSGLIEDFRYSVENMQWVAQFGNIRAIVEEISKIQKQETRARG